MKIVLLGAAGQLAHDLQQALADHEVVCWTRIELDLANPEGLTEKLQASGCQAVVNSAAYNLVDQAESEPQVAFAVNALGPRALAISCGKLGLTLLHFSTDYVFGQDATRQSPWLETDAPGPVSAYGVSKLAGEYFVRAHCPKHFVVRTCGLYGLKGSRGKGGNFVETMLRLGQSGKPVRVVSDQICTPSYTADVAKAAAQLLTADSYGLYHATNSGGCSWYELAREVFRLANLTVDLSPIPTSEYPTPARRPPFSVLSTAKLKSVGVSTPADWKDALARYLATRANRPTT